MCVLWSLSYSVRIVYSEFLFFLWLFVFTFTSFCQSVVFLLATAVDFKSPQYLCCFEIGNNLLAKSMSLSFPLEVPFSDFLSVSVLYLTLLGLGSYTETSLHWCSFFITPSIFFQFVLLLLPFLYLHVQHVSDVSSGVLFFTALFWLIIII